MTFDAILTEIQETLARDGRVAYRTLKRRFDLDDEFIEDIKLELIDAKRIARDEDDKILVSIDPRADDGASIAANAHPAESDRRLLTVMFCDVVDSTTLSEMFDAEELREVIRLYQEICAGVIEKYDGHIAQYLGDGLLVYFGYPIAQEDEAYLAVQSGLEILEALRSSSSLAERIGEPLRVRIGIHSGPVVIGEMGGGDRREHLALGETPNVAARVQSTARPDELLVSEATNRLVEGLFKVESLGPQDLKGVSKSLLLYRVVGESLAESPFEVALSTGRLTKFVGREEELSLLQQDWARTKAGNGQAALLSAEPGMGKSRLAQAFRDRIGDEAVRRVTVRCSPYHHNSPLHPIIQVAQQVFSFAPNDTLETKLRKLDSTLATYEFTNKDAPKLFREFLSLNEGEQQRTLGEERREELFLVLIEWFLQDADKGPVFSIWDDLHWADPSTLALLELYLEHLPSCAGMSLLIFRSNFSPPWKVRSDCRQLSLGRLNPEAVTSLITDLSGPLAFTETVIQSIAEKTDGIPLYVEELTRSIVESEELEHILDNDSDVTVEAVAIPMTLQDSLEARLDRCPLGKEIAQWGATIGREFNYSVLRAAVADDARVKAGISELLEAELINRSGSSSEPRFIFKHALLRDTAYESLLIKNRRRFHNRIGEVLVAEFENLRESQPELVAYHFNEAENWDEAIRYWYRAGCYANERSAYQEALGHLNRGLAVMAQQSRTPEREAMKLDIELLRGTLTIRTLGNTDPEVEKIYRSALELCKKIGPSADKTPAYFGLRSYYLTNANLEAAHAIALELHEDAQARGNDDALLEAQIALANSHHFRGDLDETEHFATLAKARYSPDRHAKHRELYGVDPGVVACIRLSLSACWRANRVVFDENVAAAIALEKTMDHPFTRGFILGELAATHITVGEFAVAFDFATQVIELADQHSFVFYRHAGQVLHGYCTAQAGDTQAGLASISEGRIGMAALGSSLVMPFMLGLHAETLGLCGDPEHGLAMLPEAFSMIQRTGARYCETELYLIKARLLHRAKLDGEAERTFREAAALAAERGALTNQLSAGLGVATLQKGSGISAETLTLLRKLVDVIGKNGESRELEQARELIAQHS